MISYDGITKENINRHDLNWSQSLDHLQRILIIGGFASGKTNTLLNLRKQQDGDDYSIDDKIDLCVQDPYEVKYQYLVKKA